MDASAQGMGGASVDLERLASRVVEQSAAVHEGDYVMVAGTVEDMTLMEAIAIQVRRRGAFPLLTVTSADLEERMYTKVPERYDAQRPELEMKLSSFLTTIISLLPESDEVYPGVPPERIAHVFAARHPLHELELKRGIRQIALGNEVYPSRARAERYGVPFEVLRDNFWHGLDEAASDLRAAAEPARRRLAAAKWVEVTNPNGTHLRMRVDGRPITVNDGVLTPEQIKAGGAACYVWLPAGELYVTPVPDSVSGTLVIDRMLLQDTKVEGLTIEFAAGKMTSLDARVGVEAVRALVDAAPAGKERFSALDIGLNPNVRNTPGGWLPAAVAAGTVSMGIGRNVWAGGDNDVSFGLPVAMLGTTVLADGVAIVNDGVLVR